MRAAVLRDGRMVYRDDVPDPVPEAGQVLVGVRACGICGSDLHFAAHGAQVLEMSDRVAGGSGAMHVDLNHDVFMGHEFSAEILEAGPDTETHPPGTLVTSLPVLLSAKGVEPIVYSNSTIGGYAERMLLSAPLLLPIPNGLDFKHASLTEPMAVGLHAVNKSNIAPGETAAGARLRPDRHRHHRGAAGTGALKPLWRPIFRPNAASWPRRWAPTRLLDPAQGSPFDTVKPAVVFEAVGVPGIIDDVLLRARPGTRLVVAGVCMQPDTVHPFFAIAKEINVQFVLAYTPEEFGDSLRALAEGDIDVSPADHRRGRPRRGRYGFRRSRRPRAALQDPRHALKVVGRRPAAGRRITVKMGLLAQVVSPARN